MIVDKFSNRKKILICCPRFGELGGVSSHYEGLAPFIEDSVDFHTVGSRRGISGSFLLPYDFILLFLKLLLCRYELVVLNPSMQSKSVPRDFLYMKLAKRLRFRVVAFFHGWDETYAVQADNNPGHIIRRFAECDGLIVLSESFRSRFLKWGFDCPIYLSTTKVTETFFDVSSGLAKSKNEKALLFLARITEEKGIFVAIEAFEKLRSKDCSYTLTVIGDGPDLASAKALAAAKGLDSIDFTGRLSGADLVSRMEISDCYIFPSWHGEGMPTSVLEAMSLGMPIVTTKCAGVIDFFISGKMGVYCDFRSVDSLVDGIEIIFGLDREAISEFNRAFAAENFRSSNVAKSLLNMLSAHTSEL